MKYFKNKGAGNNSWNSGCMNNLLKAKKSAMNFAMNFVVNFA